MISLSASVNPASLPLHRGAASGRIEPIEPSFRQDLDSLNRLRDPASWGVVRPSAESIPQEEVFRFQSLVYDIYASAIAPVAKPAVSAMAPAFIVGPSATAGLDITPADRIAATLQHLRELRCA